MKPRVTSEYTPLKKVLIHTPGEEHNQLIPWKGDHPLMGSNPRSYLELQKEHGELKNYIVEEIGKENVLELRDLLREVFMDPDYNYRYRVLKDTLYYTADTYIDHLQARGIRLDKYDPAALVEDLIQGYPRVLTLNNGRLPKLIIPPKREMMWMRDSSAATPCGMVINAMASSRRIHEPALVRSVFKYHPMFDPDSIFLDMVKFHREMKDDITMSGLYDRHTLEGGNIIVLSEDTIAVGVGRQEYEYANRTTRHGFYLLVKKLFEADTEKKLRRIYLVNVPDLRAFIHLDTIFNMVGPKSAVVMPYVFGHPTPSHNTSAKEVFQGFVKWLRRSIGVKQTDLSKVPTAEQFEHAGKVEVYDRAEIDKNKKIERMNQPARYFLDQLVTDGLLDLNRITWIGGPMEGYPSPYEHLRVALFEQHNMAGNIFTTKPYHVVAYHRNPVTAKSLDRNLHSYSEDAHLELMRSNEIRTDDGGPHCLTMPLERE